MVAARAAVAASRPPVPLARLVLPETTDRTEDPDSPATRDPTPRRHRPSKPTSLASTASQDRRDLPAHLDRPDQMVNPARRDKIRMAALVDLPDLPDPLDPPVPLVAPEMLERQVHPDKFTMCPEARDHPAQLDLPARMDSPEAPASLEETANPVRKARPAHPDPLARPETPEAMDSRERTENRAEKELAITARRREPLRDIKPDACNNHAICHLQKAIPGTQISMNLRIILLYLAFVVYSKHCDHCQQNDNK